MGLETGAALSALGGVAGAAGGGKKGQGGKKGPPTQIGSNLSQNSTQQTTFAPQSGQERALQDAAIREYFNAQNFQQDLEKRIAQLDPNQQAALQAQQGILSGQAFQATADELATIDALRQAQIQQGQQGIQQGFEDSLRAVTGGAAARGLRGQALGETRGRVAEQALQSQQALLNQANTLAAQQAMQAPQNRINAQQGYIQNAIAQPFDLRQQAMQNRALLQNPSILAQLRQERMGASTVSNSTNQQTRDQYAAPKGFDVGSALLGGLGGAATGLTGSANMADAWKRLGGGSQPQSQYATQDSLTANNPIRGLK